MYYVSKESQIKTVRTKMLLKHGRSCDSCEHFDHNSRGSLAYDFHGSDEKCLVSHNHRLAAPRYGAEIPEMRICASWTLVEIKVTPIPAEIEMARLLE